MFDLPFLPSRYIYPDVHSPHQSRDVSSDTISGTIGIFVRPPATTSHAVQLGALVLKSNPSSSSFILGATNSTTGTSFLLRFETAHATTLTATDDESETVSLMVSVRAGQVVSSLLLFQCEISNSPGIGLSCSKKIVQPSIIAHSLVSTPSFLLCSLSSHVYSAELIRSASGTAAKMV